MLSNEEHPGIFTFMVGMIVLVMAGVGLSLVVDKRLKASTAAVATQNETGEDNRELDELNSIYSDRSVGLLNAESSQRTGAQTLRNLSAQVQTLRERQAQLEKTRDQLRSSSATLEEKFSLYRADYRRKTWAAAAGQKVGTLTVRDGREYHDVTITRVTEVGLEIRHEHGIARIQTPDLDQEMQDHFQWNDAERLDHLKKEIESEHSIEEDAETLKTSAGGSTVTGHVKKKNPDQDMEKLMLSRRNVSAWRLKVIQLSSEKIEASSHDASYGNQSSVPGSLETWSAKDARLGNELIRARTALAIAKSDLGQLAPGDPLLKDPAQN